MSLPTTPAAFADCYEIWRSAVDTPGGCRSFVGPSESAAAYLRARMNQARAILRNQAERAYPREHPAWGTSEFDGYKVTIKQDEDANYWIYVEHHGNWNTVSTIEPIPIEERQMLPEAAIAAASERARSLPFTPTHLQLEHDPHANAEDLE